MTVYPDGDMQFSVHCPKFSPKKCQFDIQAGPHENPFSFFHFYFLPSSCGLFSLVLGTSLNNVVNHLFNKMYRSATKCDGYLFLTSAHFLIIKETYFRLIIIKAKRKNILVCCLPTDPPFYSRPIIFFCF